MSGCVDPTLRSWEPTELEQPDEVVAGVLRQGLAQAPAFRERGIQYLSRQPNAFATLSAADSVQIVGGDGAEFSLFVKYLGDETTRHPDKIGPKREVELYDRVFSGAGLPVPHLHRAWWNDVLDCWILAIEEVPGWDLRYMGLDHWHLAARCIADIHRHFESRIAELEQLPVLTRLTDEYYQAWLRCAVDAVSVYEPSLGGAASLLVDRGVGPTSLLADSSRTLVHNDLSPKNVLAARTSVPSRAWFVDWEMAALGSPALDIVHLIDGLSKENAAQLIEAWRVELDGSRLIPPDPPDVHRLIDAANGFQALYKAAHCRSWGLTSEDVESLIHVAETAWAVFD